MTLKKKITITSLATILLIGFSITALNQNLFHFKADEVTPPPLGETQIINLTNNGASYTNSTTDNPQIPKYEKFELTFDINWYHNRDFTNPTSKYDPISDGTINPYWPYDANPASNTQANIDSRGDGTMPVEPQQGISVDGLFLPQNETDWSKAIIQPGFYYQDYEQKTINNSDWLYPKSNPVWKIRFAPTDLNQRQYKIKVTDKTGITYYTPSNNQFAVVNSSNKGFVKVSSTDTRYFETSDGTTLNLIGANGYITETADMDTTLTKYQDMGINLLRPWWQAQQGPFVWGLTQGDNASPEWGFNLKDGNISYEQAMPGELFSIKLSGNNKLVTSATVKSNTKYRLSAWAKTVGLTGSGDYGTFLTADAVEGSVFGQKMFGDTDWTEITADITSKEGQNFMNIGLQTTGSTAGSAYFTKLEFREIIQNTPTGLGPSGHISKPDINIYKYVSQQQSWKADYMVESAKQHGIYLKVVIENKEDRLWGRIGKNGRPGSSSNDNVYATQDHASRIYQEYYWRYLTARYGYSTAVHSWEFVNEGDPYNANHKNALFAFSNYIKSSDPNKHLTTTSNWHSYQVNMWDNEAVGYGDLHRYTGYNVYNNEYVLWPGWDGPLYDAINSATLGTNFSFDNTTSHSGNNSLKVSVPYADSVQGTVTSTLYTQVGVKVGHDYQITYWAKGQNLPDVDNGGGAWNPSINVYYTGEATMWDGWPSTWWRNYKVGNPCGKWAVDPGTYEWTKVTTPAFKVSASGQDTKLPSRYLGINFTYRPNPSVNNTVAWFDDVEIKDLTTGEILNYNGNFEDTAPISEDVVANHLTYSRNLYSFHTNKPAIRGEMSFVNPRTELPATYLGYTKSQLFDRLLAADTEGVWWRKFSWANIDFGGLTEMIWDNKLLLDRQYSFAKSFQNFMSGIQLSNGKYSDVAAQSTNTTLRVLGQKEVIDGKSDRAHLWLDNKAYTWKNVVDAAAGTATLASPISGTVVIPDMKDGWYKLEWWDTTTGVISSTEAKETSNGNLTLTVNNLVSDIALKVYPTEKPTTPITTYTNPTTQTPVTQTPTTTAPATSNPSASTQTQSNATITAPKPLSSQIKLTSYAAKSWYVSRETVTIKNTGKTSLNTKGWRLKNSKGKNLKLPSYTIKPGKTLTIHTTRAPKLRCKRYLKRVNGKLKYVTSCAKLPSGHLYLGKTTKLFNRRHDTITLVDTKNQVIFKKKY